MLIILFIAITTILYCSILLYIVFTACGHVHGYHKSLEGRPCPLCRKHGAFVPIAFEFEAAISDCKPTHVFNPCKCYSLCVI